MANLYQTWGSKPIQVKHRGWFVWRRHCECYPVCCGVAWTYNGGFPKTDNARYMHYLRLLSARTWTICLQLPPPLLQLLLFISSPPTLHSECIGH